MKKSFAILSVLIILSMLLAALWAAGGAHRRTSAYSGRSRTNQGAGADPGAGLDARDG